MLAVNRLAALVSGKSFPLVGLIVPATIVVAVRELRRMRPPARVDLLALLGLGSLSLVFAVYSQHLSALGLDLHEHVAWIRQITAHGFVPLDEGGTGILGDYPRTFHLLAALWNAAGLALPAGPWAKAMPFLQNALPALALAELAVEARAAGAPPAARRNWEIAVALAFYGYAFLLVTMVYPTTDLFGTPRFSSGGLLLLPVVLLALARTHDAPRASLVAIACAPLLGAWALTWNPIVALLPLLVTLPVAVAFRVALQPPRLPEKSGRALVVALAACGALGLLAVIQDPWVLQTAAQRIPASRKILERAGLLTFDEAVRRGLATAREKSVRNLAPAPPCGDAACVVRAAGSAAADAARVPWEAVRAGAAALARLPSPALPWLREAFRDAVPLGSAMIADYAGLPYATLVLAGVLAWGFRRLRKRPCNPATGRLLLASLVGVAAAGTGLAFAARTAAALNDHGHESEILAAYLSTAGSHVSLSLLWLPLLAATLALAEPVIARGGSDVPPARAARRAWAAAGLAVWLALPLLARLNLHRPLQHGGFHTRIAWEDLRALREIEAAIPPGDGVVVPAEHANIASWEHWVLPTGHTAALLPYGERRYLFNVYLGASYPLSWRDLDAGLCSEEPAVRTRFLERTGARWILVRDPEAAGVATLPHAEICDGSLAALGAELPAFRERRGIFLFRLGR